MTLSSGTKLGPYEIESPLGTGGMGEVYRARDTRLGREVALKILPTHLATNAELKKRFDREAKSISSLTHPNICSLFDIGHQDGTDYLVMELVDGPTLAERIRDGAIPLEEAISIAKQIADALEYAHERGLIHRDLKPANISLTRAGKVKVLDFGLAKALQCDAAAADPLNSPTFTMDATKAGIILGTAAYMSPEQAKGKPVDRRADIWSFGVVLFEMLSGRQAFPGETTTDIMAAVLRADPDWTCLPGNVPGNVRLVLRRCLVKDERRRLRDIGDALLELESNEMQGTSLDSRHSMRRAQLLGLAPWVFAVAAVAVAVAVGVSYRRNGETHAHEVMHLDITYPPDVEPVSGLQGGFAVSPDGRTVAMIGVKDGVRRLYVRRLDRAEAVGINEAAGVNSVFFSPDSSSVAFVPGNTILTRISLTNQESSTLASGADLANNVAWGPKDIIFNRGGALWIVPATGGSPRQLTHLDAGRHEVVHGDPLILPGGRTVLFSSLTTDEGAERIEAVGIDGSHRRVIVERATSPAWSPTGHLLFGRDGAVWAVPFDPETATVHGDALPVIPAGVIGTVRSGSMGFQVSSTGTLVYLPADFDLKLTVSVGRDGSESILALPAHRYANPRISPDGRLLVVENEGTSIETLDLQRGTRAKLVAGAMGTSFPTWTVDSKTVVFRRFNVLFWVAADGSGRMGLVPGGVINDYPSSPGPDPDSVIGVRINPDTSGDVYLFSVSGKSEPRHLIQSPAYEGGAQLSFDRRWLVYQSNESGQPEIYVRRYPALDRRWQVSEGGGVQPRWSPADREIYYRSGSRMMAVKFDPSNAEPVLGKPTLLFTGDYDYGQGLSIANYDVTRDGRFIMLRRESHASSLRVVINWTDELQRILASGGVR